MKKNNKNLRILAYHTIKDRANFERQLIYLKQNYSIVSIDQLNSIFNKNLKFPKKLLLITFDDGDISVFENALPLLKIHNLPATLFVITDLISSHKPFWWDEIEYYLGRDKGNKKVWEVKKWPNKKRESYLKKLRMNSQIPNFEYPQLTIAQLKEMQANRIVIANHSHKHPMFNKCDMNELREDMHLSTFKLKEWDFSPNIFAYPNGNYSEKSESILKEFKIDLAFLFDHRINTNPINPLRLSRLIVDDTTPMWKFKFILSGWHSRILPITKAIGKFK